MSGDQLDLDAVEARANAATPGPWHGSHEDYGQCVHVGDYGYVCSGPNAPDYDGGIGEQGRDDAEFIAHAREDVPALVAEVRRLRAQNDQLAIRLGRRMTGPEIGAAISHGIQTGAIELPAEGERMYSTDEVKAILGLDEQ